jgi:hypothetical protein
VHRFSAWIEAMLEVQNLTDRYTNDVDVWSASIGRQTKVGFRIRL